VGGKWTLLNSQTTIEVRNYETTAMTGKNPINGEYPCSDGIVAYSDHSTVAIAILHTGPHGALESDQRRNIPCDEPIAQVRLAFTDPQGDHAGAECTSAWAAHRQAPKMKMHPERYIHSSKAMIPPKAP